MLKQKIQVIFNPAADLGRARRLESTIHSLVNELGGAEWTPTRQPGHARELAIEAGKQGFERVIAAGGDGTMHETANGLMQITAQKRPILGIIPIGSGNDFAASLGIAMDKTKALESAFNAKSHPVDIGSLQTNSKPKEYWLNVVGIGFDAVADIRARRMPIFHGFWLYLLAALQTILFNHTPYRFTAKLDGKDWQRELLMLIISNGRSEGGGFKIAPHARLDDGLFNLIGVQKISRLRMLLTLPYFMRGTHARLPYVETD